METSLSDSEDEDTVDNAKFHRLQRDYSEY